MTQTSASKAPVNRYESAAAWREVDDYFAGILTPEDSALIAARESGVETTMPNAEVAPNQGALLGLLTHDLVFIDAGKPNNPAFLDAALKLTNPGSIIAIDNVVRDGAVTQTGTVPTWIRHVHRY